jgi:hypothetical protein
MNATDETISTPKSLCWGNKQFAAKRIEKKEVSAAACRRKEAAVTVANHWLNSMEREWSNGFFEVGIVKWLAFRKGHYDEDGKFFCEFGGREIFDAIMLMGENGWYVQPRYERFYLVFKKLMGITIGQAPDGYQPSIAFHQRWTEKLKAGFA